MNKILKTEIIALVLFLHRLPDECNFIFINLTIDKTHNKLSEFIMRLTGSYKRKCLLFFCIN